MTTTVCRSLLHHPADPLLGMSKKPEDRSPNASSSPSHPQQCWQTALPPSSSAPYLADPLVNVEVKLPAHIEAEPVPIATLVVDVDEGDANGVGALRIERHPVGPAVLRVAQELVEPLAGGKLGLNLVHLLPSSLRRHLGKEHSSSSSTRMQGQRADAPKREIVSRA